MISDDVVLIKTWSEANRSETSVDLVMANDHVAHLFEKAMEIVSEHALNLHVYKKKDHNNQETYIQINKNIRFMALPQGKILRNFLEIIAFDEPYYSRDQDQALCDSDISSPVLLKIYISPFCTFCPAVVRDISILALRHDNVFLDIIDGVLFKHKSDRDKVMAAPTIICDDTFRWTGQVALREIKDVICRRKPAEFNLNNLKAIIEEGKASTLADMIIHDNFIYPAFYDLLTHEKWPVRLGAMVTAETIHETNKALSETLCSELWKRISYVPDVIKGDIIYLIGGMGGQFYLNELRTLMNDVFDVEIQEAIEDALENIRIRFSL